MKARMMIGTVAVGLLSVATVGARAQAIAVGADGTMQQEKSAPVIAPENQATADQPFFQPGFDNRVAEPSLRRPRVV